MALRDRILALSKGRLGKPFFGIFEKEEKKEEPFRFEVGEGLTPEQRRTALETVRKETILPPATLLQRARNVFVPKAGDILRRIQEERQQTLSPIEAIKEVQREGQRVGTIFPAPAGTLDPQTGKVAREPSLLEFARFRESRGITVDPFLVGSIEKRGARALTTSILNKIGDRKSVSKQFISDLANQPELKQAEREFTRRILSEFPEDRVDVQKFTERVERDLLPLNFSDTAGTNAKGVSFVPDDGLTRDNLLRYENIALPKELRGNVIDYDEVIYQSPIRNSAGGIHFDTEVVPNYFAHVRVEDLEKPTRRIIELQSDLFQKGRLEREIPKEKGLFEITQEGGLPHQKWIADGKNALETLGFKQEEFLNLTSRDIRNKLKNQPQHIDYFVDKLDKYKRGIKRLGYLQQTRTAELSQLQPYRNTWHERIIKEEIRRAAQDGKTRLQFPTGETAMKVEGLGESVAFKIEDASLTPTTRMRDFRDLTTNNMKVGMQIFDRGRNNWIITEVLGDGKFKAVPKSRFDEVSKFTKETFGNPRLSDRAFENKKAEQLQGSTETFDISGRIDKTNPIYRFYEDTVQKFLRRIQPDVKRIKDPRGVEWFEIKIAPRLAKAPVEAFGAVGGVEIDEEGQLGFDPAKATAGVALLAGRGRLTSFLERFRRRTPRQISDPERLPEVPAARRIRDSLIQTVQRLGQRIQSRFARESLDQSVQRIPSELPAKAADDIVNSYGEILAQNEEIVKRVASAIKEAKPLRAKQETIFSKERGKRLSRALEVRERVTGEAGFFAEKSKLAGQLPRVEFESIRRRFTQKEIDALYRAIADSPLITEWEKFPAREGLAKLFGQAGGQVPTKNEISLLNKIFGPELTKAISDKRTLFQKFSSAFEQSINLPLSLMTSFDLSAPFRQGIFLIGHPKRFFASFLKMFKQFGSEKAHKAIMDEINSRPTRQLMSDSGLSLTEVAGTMTQREEKFMSQWAEKIPLVGRGVKASNRAFTGFLNRLRADVFDDIVKRAETLDPNSTENLDLTKAIATYLNAASGRGPLGRLSSAATVLNGLFFSPRLMMSRLILLNPAWYIKQPKLVRKEALKGLFTFAGAATTLLTLARLGGAEVSDDPTNADFGKIKVGDTRIDIMGGFQQYIRLAAQLLTGKITSSTTGKTLVLGEGYGVPNRWDILLRAFEFKTAPVTSFVIGMFKGENAIGEDFEVTDELKNRFTPMVAQDAMELYRENPKLMPFATLAIFGFGLQTYRERTLKDIAESIKKAIDEGTISLEAAEIKFRKEVEKLERRAKTIRFELPPQDYAQELKNLIEAGELTESQAREEFSEYQENQTLKEGEKSAILNRLEQGQKESGFIDSVLLYAKAIGTDPMTAFHRIFTGQKIRRLDNGTIIVERLPLEESEAIKLQFGSVKGLILDHTIPLQIGGSNSKRNLKLVPEEEWKRYTPIENILGQALRQEVIDKKTAQDMILKFKNGELTEKDIATRLKEFVIPESDDRSKNTKEFNTREDEGFRFPDYATYSGEIKPNGSRNIRADMKLNNNSKDKKRYNIEMVLVGPSGQRIVEPQTAESLEAGERTSYGLEARYPDGAEKGKWGIEVIVNGNRVIDKPNSFTIE